MVREIELRVHASTAIVRTASGGCAALAVDEHRPQKRPLEDVALDARNCKLLARDAEACRRVAQPARLHLKKSDVVATDLARHFRAVINRHWRAVIREADAAREEELIGLFPAEEEDAG